MAGFYNWYQDGDQFVTLTTEANDSMRPVHDWVPLVLEQQINVWLIYYKDENRWALVYWQE